MRCWLFLIIYSTNLSLKYLSSVLKGKINLEVVLSSSESSEKLLIGKILSNKSFPGNLVKEILVKAWNVINDIEVTVVDKNIFMFSFLYEADVRRAWDKRPWTVKGEHLILKRFCSDISVSEVDFSTTEFWIQIHGLPLNRRSKENVLKIGSIAGKALDTDLIGPGSRIWSKSVRVRVELDIRCPLVPGFPLEMDNLPVLWIPFKFEKLGNFCFGCGLLGHDLLNCQELGVQNCGFFGKWLRVDNGEFQPGIKLDDFLIPNCQAMVSTLPTSRPSVQINQSSRIQSAKDSRDEMITGEAHGKREEPMEVLEQSKMVTLLQNDGTSLEKINKLCNRLKFVDSWCVDSNGKSGGLALFWRLGVKMEVVFSDRNMIVALVYSDPPEAPWLLFAIYGPFQRSKRKKFWELLENMVSSFSGPWVVIGDLNCIKRAKEKCGGRLVAESSVHCLRDFMVNTSAIDLGFIGPSFTWSNRREGLANKKERLDQCLCDQEWQTLFPKAGVRHMCNSNSDHNPIMLDTPLDSGKWPHPFRFEAMWTKEEGSRRVVEGAWQTWVEGSHGFKLAKKLSMTCRDLLWWNKEKFGNTKEKIKYLQNKISLIQQAVPSRENLNAEASLNLELDDWLAREDLRLRQISRELWVKEGDCNSRFFHLSTIIRRCRNCILKIKLDDGSWIRDREDIQSYFLENFSTLYNSGYPQFPVNLENLIQPRVSYQENLELCKVPSRDEIKKVVFGMKALKAPGPDGFPALFYKHYWDIVGDQLVFAVQSFFLKGWLLKDFNKTFISLIPKKKGAHNFNHFRLIGLCNMSYKVISKIIVNRLRPLLDKMVDPAQVAFVPNRWINENMVLAHEVVHSFKHTGKKKGFLGIKLDFQKAYNRMEWSFLLEVLRAFGFSSTFVNLIHQYLSSVDFSLLLNGGQCPSFSPSQGLRQGDPISPYLFILGSEILLRLINMEVDQKRLSVVKVSNTAPPISKLCYADNIILFCKEKSSELATLKGLNILSNNTTYLGVPLFLSRSRNQDFRYIKERLDCKLSGWKSKNLSWSRRATLIKSVAQAIPVYAMSAIQFPKGLCEQLDASTRRFWWNPKSKSGSYWSPVSWSTLCWPRKDCLCVKVLRAKYKIRNNWLSHSYHGHASPFWKSLLGIKHIIAKAACIVLGNGDSIRIWSDPWILDLPGYIPSPKVDADLDLALVVSQLFSSDHSRWDIHKLNYFFDETVVDLILKIPIPINQFEDSWSWMVTNSGSFSAKSAYWLYRAASSPSNIDATRGQIWKSKLHERLKMHLWRIAANVLPSKEWGLRMEAIGFESTSDFIGFLISPPFVANMNPCQRKDFLLFGAILYDVIWKLRNRSLFDIANLNLDGVMTRLSSLFAEHKNSRASFTTHLDSASPQVWFPPSRRDIKINVDAAVGPRFSAIAVVVRNWRGELVFAGSKKVNTTLPLQAKAKAVRWAISFAPALDGDSVHVESDSQVVVQLLSNLTLPPPWRIRSLCVDLSSLLALHSNMFVSWIPRLCNQAAHILAKWCLSCNFFGSFGCGSCPNCLSSVVARESSKLL
ncbi:uncharacterized protein LOC136067578 [Quercus suber]|uniref:uncharacterized protein LOC136067578 n=1 Tax=Quercus suber TaxID=58331 RepID=UPI0032DEEA57